MADLDLTTIQPLIDRAAGVCPTIVFPEGDSPMMAEVAAKIAELGAGKPILLGDLATMQAHDLDLSGCELFDPSTEEGQAKKLEMAGKLAEILKFPAKIVAKKMKTTLDLAAVMVRLGEADTFASGYVFNTAQTISAATMFMGLAEGVTYSTSFMVAELPHYTGPAGENGMFILTDTSLCFGDTPEELAEIAINAADGAANMMGWEPRVAMLSFSTKGSGKRDCATKVIDATNLVKERCPELKIDGELQFDAAMVPAIAAKKCGEDNPVEGKANVLVYPNMDAANIGCKMVQFMADGTLYGPLLKGLYAPVAQIGRGYNFKEILGTCILALAGCQK